MLYPRTNPFSAVRIVAETLSRYVRNIVGPPQLKHATEKAATSFETFSPSPRPLSTRSPRSPEASNESLLVSSPPQTTPSFSGKANSQRTDPIVRPPSPPGGKGRHNDRNQGFRNAYEKLFADSSASSTLFTAALATETYRYTLHATRRPDPLHFAYTRGHQLTRQMRFMSMPAVASQPDTLGWFKRRESPSIFELFEKVWILMALICISFMGCRTLTVPRIRSQAVPTTRRTFRFSHAASAMPKKPMKPEASSQQYLSVQVGEDAYFVRPDSLGVADGVGGWAQVKGANPALYSRKIMHYASAELEKLDDIMDADYTIEDYNNVDPRAILQKSYDLTNRDAVEERLLGSTTALIAILRDDELRIANVGDCGILIIRNNVPIFRTEEQQHSFNFPYQLGTGSRDSPADAQTFSVKIEEGDIVILGSDGMFDNVFDEDIVDIVRNVTAGSKPTSVDPQRISDALLRKAREVAEDGRFSSSPFQTRAIQEGLYYQGGKMDDVTVLAGVIR